MGGQTRSSDTVKNPSDVSVKLSIPFRVGSGVLTVSGSYTDEKVSGDSAGDGVSVNGTTASPQRSTVRDNNKTGSIISVQYEFPWGGK